MSIRTDKSIAFLKGIAQIIEPDAFGETPDPMSPTEREIWQESARRRRDEALQKALKIRNYFNAHVVEHVGKKTR